MIYTCTTNPSLDYFVSIESLKKGTSNRLDFEMYDAGGKGVNVSIVLNNFRITSTALGFLGGFTKEYYVNHINNYPNIVPLFTTIADNTRINVKIMEADSETGLNAKGPKITDEEFAKFKNRINKIYDDDTFVISGNIQDEIKDRMIDIIHELADEKVKVVLDVDPDVTDRCLDCHPYIVKINDFYLKDKNMDALTAGKDLVNKGAQYVLYSNAGKPSYLFSKDETLTCKNLENNLINTTGSSDSLVAGAIYAFIKGASAVEAFKYANAASLATSMSNDLGSKEKIEELVDTIEVESI